MRNTHVHLCHTCTHQLQMVVWEVVEATLVYFWLLEAFPSFFLAVVHLELAVYLDLMPSFFDLLPSYSSDKINV